MSVKWNQDKERWEFLVNYSPTESEAYYIAHEMYKDERSTMELLSSQFDSVVAQTRKYL